MRWSEYVDGFAVVLQRVLGVPRRLGRRRRGAAEWCSEFIASASVAGTVEYGMAGFYCGDRCFELADVRRQAGQVPFVVCVWRVVTRCCHQVVRSLSRCVEWWFISAPGR